jgi:hypothetical protein
MIGSANLRSCPRPDRCRRFCPADIVDCRNLPFLLPNQPACRCAKPLTASQQIELATHGRPIQTGQLPLVRPSWAISRAGNPCRSGGRKEPSHQIRLMYRCPDMNRGRHGDRESPPIVAAGSV